MATLETQFKNFLQENPDVNPTFDEWVKLKFSNYCECANPDETLFNESVNRGCINDGISDWDVTLMDGLGDEPYEREIKSYEELKKHFKITLNHLLLDKESQNDEEIIDFYINVFCDMTESYVAHKNNELYSEIEHLIIQWNIDGTKTAGSLTRDIMKLL